MTRRRSTTSRRGVRPGSAERALFILCATVYVAEVTGGVGLLVMSLWTAVILLSMVGEFQPDLSQRLVC